MEEFSLVSLLIGAGIGLVLGAGGLFAWFRYGDGAGGGTSARRREEIYRKEVADHFVKTAKLVNQLTDSYKEVFDHLRDGAGNLVDDEILRERLAHQDSEKVTLRRIGYAADREGGDQAKAGDEGEAKTEDKTEDKTEQKAEENAEHKAGEGGKERDRLREDRKGGEVADNDRP